MVIFCKMIKLGWAVSRAWFGHTGATEMLYSFIKMIHFDTFKQTWVADPGIHKVFNSTFLSVLLKCLRTSRRICVKDMVKWLMLFRISSPLIWAPSLGSQTGILSSESLWICPCWVLILKLIVVDNKFFFVMAVAEIFKENRFVKLCKSYELYIAFIFFSSGFHGLVLSL